MSVRTRVREVGKLRHPRAPVNAGLESNSRSPFGLQRKRPLEGYFGKPKQQGRGPGLAVGLQRIVEPSSRAHATA
jgi:hypothetical protein